MPRCVGAGSRTPDAVKPPVKKRPQLRPPNAEQMARIVEAAWKASNEWGLYVWLSAVTGARRGEVVALQWNDIDLANGILRLDENYVRATDGMILKDTKPPDAPGVDRQADGGAAAQAQGDCTQRLRLLGTPLSDDTRLLSAQPHLSKRDPTSVTRRYSRLVGKLGINTQLKNSVTTPRLSCSSPS